MSERQKGFVRAHERGVKAFARQQGITKGSASVVLTELLRYRNYKTLTAFRSRDNLVEDTGYCDKTVKKAMATLRAKEIIVPVAYEHGGRGCSTIYKFSTKLEKGGENATPYESGDENGGTLGPKRGNFKTETGEESTPPTIRQKNNRENKDPAGRREVNKASGPQTEEEHRKFDQFLRTEGNYTNAMIALQEWRKKSTV